MAPAAIGIRLVRTIATLLLVLCALVLLGWPAGQASAEWFGDLYMGGAFTERGDLNVGRDTFRDVSFDTSGLVGGRAGYWIGDFEYVGVAFDVLHYRPHIGTQTVRPTTFDPSTTQLRGIDVGVTALSFDVLVRAPLLKDEAVPSGRLQPYALVGPIPAITRAADSSNFGHQPISHTPHRGRASASGPVFSGNSTSVSGSLASMATSSSAPTSASFHPPRCSSTSGVTY
jgi:hypothetical protein